MLFTFPNIVERNSLVNNKDIKNWFVSLKPWNGESSSLSRIVWINCRGMPLSAWSNSSFRIIGELWGEFLGLEENTREAVSFDVGKMLIVTDQKKNKIDEWINISVN